MVISKSSRMWRAAIACGVMLAGAVVLFDPGMVVIPVCLGVMALGVFVLDFTGRVDVLTAGLAPMALLAIMTAHEFSQGNRAAWLGVIALLLCGLVTFRRWRARNRERRQKQGHWSAQESRA